MGKLSYPTKISEKVCFYNIGEDNCISKHGWYLLPEWCSMATFLVVCNTIFVYILQRIYFWVQPMVVVVPLWFSAYIMRWHVKYMGKVRSTEKTHCLPTHHSYRMCPVWSSRCTKYFWLSMLHFFILTKGLLICDILYYFPTRLYTGRGCNNGAGIWSKAPFNAYEKSTNIRT